MKNEDEWSSGRFVSKNVEYRKIWGLSFLAQHGTLVRIEVLKEISVVEECKGEMGQASHCHSYVNGPYESYHSLGPS